MNVREPDVRNQMVDPSDCDVMEGHQHPVAEVDALADSIAVLGQLNPVQMVEYPDGRRLVVAGRRRWLACKKRKLDMRADIWRGAPDDLELENFSRAIRIVENTERCEPSAIDIAIQLRTLRKQNGFSSAATLSQHLGMGESRIKTYLSVFQASDHLEAEAHKHRFSLSMLLELVKYEKTVGQMTAKKAIAQVARGELSKADVKKMRQRKVRARVKESSSSRTAKQKSTDSLDQCVQTILEGMEADPIGALPFVESLEARLRVFLERAQKQKVTKCGSAAKSSST